MIIRLLRGTSVQWLDSDPVLQAGEQGYETDTGRFKIGDGYSTWSQLDYFIPANDVVEAINEAISNSNPSGTDVQAAIDVHVNDANPHPVYDDGPSLLLLYQNAKV